jgi:hypothetical protein
LEAAGYGLRQEALSPLETLAQSISSMCRTFTPLATLPLGLRLREMPRGSHTFWPRAVSFGWPGRFARLHRFTRIALFLRRVGTPAVAGGWGRVQFGVGLAGSASNICGFYYFANAMLNSITEASFYFAAALLRTSARP